STINGTATQQTRSSNATCTINIPSASVDYWFGPTYNHVVGIMTTQASNFSNVDSYTLVPYTTTFDASSALASDYACIYSESYYAEWDFTVTMCEEYTARPKAATTSVAYRSAGYSPFPSGNVIPTSDAGLYDLFYPDTFPSATATITLGPNTMMVQTSATPFVYFTAYEIESGNKTQTVQLRSTQVYPYWMQGFDEENTVTGSLPDGFLNQVPQSACDAGQLKATVVTVLIVVDLYYQNWPGIGPALIHVESSVLGFDDGPVVVNGWGGSTSKAPPLTVSDWNLPGDNSKPTPTIVKPNDRPHSVPTTKMRGSENNNAVNPPEFTRVTVGSVGTKPVVVGPSSRVVVGSQTLQAGGPPVNIGGGTMVSLAPSATAIVVDGRTSMLPQVTPSRPPPVLTIGSTTLTPNAATQFFVGPGQTLTPGGIATVDGTVVSLAPSASFVVIGGSTQILPGSGPAPNSPPQLVVGGSTITAQATQGTSNNLNSPDNPRRNPTFVVSGQTLAPGGPAITFSGTTISLAPSASFVVVNGITSALAIPTPQAGNSPTITIGNDIIGALSEPSGPTFVIDGQTLVPGGPEITVSGTTLSLAQSASFVVINGVTSTLATPASPQITAPPLTIGDLTFGPLPGTSTAYLIGSRLLTVG
ncbi:hypothetical protein BKA58DRAFT_286488, partial [Alternaria rosae]|uniref:uncharacterized protein n=1 Tax=Alternaria rosae TaxID=1187941 RepID=UPI001E8EE899